MSPAVESTHKYVENPDFVPDPTALRGTFETSGTSGLKQYDYDAVVDVFAKDKSVEPDEPDEIDDDEIDGDDDGDDDEAAGAGGVPVETVPASDAGDQTVVTGTTDTTGTGGQPQSPQAPVVENTGVPTSTGGDTTTEGAGAATAEAQGTVDTTGTDQPTTSSVQTASDFSPIGRTIPAIEKYLATVDEAERERVLDIERNAANPRSTLLSKYEAKGGGGTGSEDAGDGNPEATGGAED